MTDQILKSPIQLRLPFILANMKKVFYGTGIIRICRLNVFFMYSWPLDVISRDRWSLVVKVSVDRWFLGSGGLRSQGVVLFSWPL